MARTRILIAGLGDSGLLTATHLAGRRDLEIVGVSSRPGLVSGQELGLRLARPDRWARDYRVPFAAFRRLDGVRTIHGEITGLDLAGRRLRITTADGAAIRESWDLLVISTGVSNGFWRPSGLQSDADVDRGLRAAHQRLAAAESIVVVGGGAAAVSSALQLALRWPERAVTLAFPRDRALTQHHPRVWARVRRRLEAAGVRLLPGRRAVLPAGFAADVITTGPVRWEGAAPPTRADAVLWTIGRIRPHTTWLPDALLDDGGFVRVTPTLQVPGHPDVFAVGDVAATDPLRASARNRADRLLAANLRAHVAGRALRTYAAPRRRWGSVLGVEPDGLRVFTPHGRVFRFPRWSVHAVLQPWIVRRGIYGGVRDREIAQRRP